MANQDNQFIDLGQESTGCCVPESSKKGEKKKYYPTLYISGVEGLDLQTGDIEFRAKGRVVSISRRESADDGEKCSCEIEVHSINYPGAVPEDDSEDSTESKLDSKLSEIEKKKASEEGDDYEE